MRFEIFTDGSSYIGSTDKTQRASSCAYKILIYGRQLFMNGRFLPGGTNNSGEVSAVLDGLRALDESIKRVRSGKIKPPYDVWLYTDSLITRDSCKTDIYKWIKRGSHTHYINSAGDAVANQTIYRSIYREFLTNPMYDITFIHINSHCIETAIYRSNMDKIIAYVDNPVPRLRKQIPEEVFTHPKLIHAMKTFYDTNGMEISETDLLRLLIHNKDVDELAAGILNEGLEESGIRPAEVKKWPKRARS